MTAVSNGMGVVLRSVCFGLALMPAATEAQQIPLAPAPAAQPAAGAPAQAAAPTVPAVPAPPAAGPQSLTAPSPESVVITGDKQAISTGVAAIVNDFVISDYDLDQRVQLFVTTSGIRPTKETLAQIRAQVLRTLEDEVLELQEANKHKITVNKAEVDRAIQNISDDNKVSVAQILQTVQRAGVTVDTFRQQIAAQVIWQKVVTARYGTDIFVNDQQIDEAMTRLRQGSDKPQFLVSEIFIAVDRPEDETSVHASADQIAAQLTQGAPFGTVAGQFSQSPSAAEGGEIGWVVQGQLSEEVDQALQKLRPGQIAGPVRAEGGYYIVLLRDRREPVGTRVEDMLPPQAIYNPDTPLPLDRLLFPLAAASDATVKQKALEVANNVRGQVRSCNDLGLIANQIPGSVYNHLGQMKPADLNQDLRNALAKSDPGQVVPPFLSPVGVEIIMRCDPPIQKPVAFQLPSREQLQQQLFIQQMTILAKSYLRDLRRDAVVDTR